jgi:hypothetical protein
MKRKYCNVLRVAGTLIDTCVESGHASHVIAALEYMLYGVIIALNLVDCLLECEAKMR